MLEGFKGWKFIPLPFTGYHKLYWIPKTILYTILLTLNSKFSKLCYTTVGYDTYYWVSIIISNHYNTQ